MSSQTYVVSPATASDAPGIVVANKAAFADNPTTQILFPQDMEHLTPRDEFHAWRVERFEDMVTKGDTLMKATPANQPDVVAGFAHWRRPGHFAKKEHRRGDLFDETGQKKESVPACINGEALAEFSASIESAREKIWGDNHNYWYLAILAVHPDFQGKGIGSKLIQHGIDLADKDGVPLFVIASERGTPVYRKHGFEPKDEPRKFRGRETYLAMVKGAKPQSGELTE